MAALAAAPRHHTSVRHAASDVTLQIVAEMTTRRYRKEITIYRGANAISGKVGRTASEEVCYSRTN